MRKTASTTEEIVPRKPKFQRMLLINRNLGVKVFGCLVLTKSLLTGGRGGPFTSTSFDDSEHLTGHKRIKTL